MALSVTMTSVLVALIPGVPGAIPGYSRWVTKGSS